MQALLFKHAETASEPGAPDPARVVAGHPVFALRNHYSDRTGQFFSGEWSASAGAWRVVYAPHEEEFCLLLEGQVRLTSSEGTVQMLCAGDAFVIPGGFEGTWENIGPVRKLYATMTLKEPQP